MLGPWSVAGPYLIVIGRWRLDGQTDGGSCCGKEVLSRLSAYHWLGLLADISLSSLRCKVDTQPTQYS